MLHLFINAQGVKWIIEPLIEDGLKIYMPENCKELIEITKNGRSGLINLKNQIVVPIEYQWVHVTHNDRLVNAAKIGGGNDYYTGKGKKISEEKFKKLFKKIKEIRPENFKEKFLEKLETLKRLGSNLKIELGNDNISRLNMLYNVINPQGDTLAIGTNMKREIYNNQFITIYDERTYETMFVDVYSGEIISSAKKLEVVANKNGFILINDKNDYKILDAKGHLIGNFKAASLNSDYNFAIINEGDSNTLLNLETNEKIGPVVKKLIYLKKGDFYLFAKDHSFSFYNVTNQQLINVPYTYFNYSSEFNSSVIIESEGLKGLYNLEKNELTLPTVYKRIRFMIGNMLLCEEIKEPQNSKYQVLFDVDGNELYRGSNEKIYIFKRGFIITKADKTRLLYNSNGQLIQSFDAFTKISLNADGNFITIKKDEKSYTKHIDFLNRKQGVQFDFIKREVKFNKTKNRKWYIVQLGEMLGLMDQNGDLVLPLKYTKIEFDRFNDKIIMVQKDNKWGIIEHP